MHNRKVKTIKTFLMENGFSFKQGTDVAIFSKRNGTIITAKRNAETMPKEELPKLVKMGFIEVRTLYPTHTIRIGYWQLIHRFGDNPIAKDSDYALNRGRNSIGKLHEREVGKILAWAHITGSQTAIRPQ
jgi:hypothetical protein